MTDRCKKCGRENADYLNGDHYTDGRDRCWRDNAVSCQVTAAFRRGLREGVELAKGFLGDHTPDSYWRDWTDVDAELERRLK